MEDNEIYTLLISVAENSGQRSGDIMRVFSSLIKSTLKYRDHLKKSKGITVTVEDVREALNWLVSALRTGQLPATINKTRLDLLKIWLDELKPFGNPNIYLC